MTEHQIGDFYTHLYTKGKGHDSPLQSRINMQRRIVAEVEKEDQPVTILGVGAGRGDVEGMLIRNAYGVGSRPWHDHIKKSQIVTIDIADIPSRKLVALGKRQHIRADSRNLPFTDNSFDIVTSNLSIDMLRRNQNNDYEDALKEVSRVVRLGGGAVLLSFHSPDLYDNLSAYYQGDKSIPAKYYDGNEKNNPFYRSSDEITDDLSRAGLRADTIRYIPEGRTLGANSWWEVTAFKD